MHLIHHIDNKYTQPIQWNSFAMLWMLISHWRARCLKAQADHRIALRTQLGLIGSSGEHTLS